MKFKMIKNTEENRTSKDNAIRLNYGFGYIVAYADANGDERAAFGIWQGQDFFYPTMLTRLPPKLSDVIEYSCVKEWRPEDGS